MNRLCIVIRRGSYRVSKNTWKLFDVKSNSEQCQASYICHGNKQLQKTVTFLWMISSLPFKLDTIEQHNVTVRFFHFRKPSERAVRIGGGEISNCVDKPTKRLFLVLVRCSNITIPPVLWLKLREF